MLFKEINSNPKRHHVSLNAVIEKFKFSREAVILILRHAGFEILDSPNSYLNENHLEILSQSYIESFKSHFNSVSKNFYSYSKKEQEEYKLFYSKFLQQNFWSNIQSTEKLINSKLNGNKIKDYFYSKIKEIEVAEIIEQFDYIFKDIDSYNSFGYYSAEESDTNFDSIIKNIGYRLKLKVKRKLTLSKEIFSTILINSHYHIFTDEEEHNGEAISKNSFSIVKYTNREALKIIHFLKLISYG
ncbi:hypothetical protein M9Q43_02865 [Flavobacterium sp. HXWNR29]|uniref:hypothetical protein n=1 Tax=Flavobacterium odoriferum TaxID=2946604 RepID=UPI0021CB5BB3|nr:hypothetical protein [Flavobacterium sp. HXWNR29]MCU4188106.1 hypothetical protein [Flavobacterium sp. HXWNR29]